MLDPWKHAVVARGPKFESDRRWLCLLRWPMRWHKPTELLPYAGRGSEYQPECGNALRSGNKGKMLIPHCSVYSRHFFGGGEIPPPKENLQFPPNGCQIVCSECFFGRDSELQIYHGNFLLMDNKQRKLFVTKNNRNGSNLCPKCTKIHLAAWLCPDSLEELIRSPDSGGYF